VTRWPLWRLLVWIEVWLLIVAAFHRSRPIHAAFVVPLLLAFVPAAAMVGFWALARAAVGDKADAERRANWLEVAIAVVCVAACSWWIVEWALEARADLRRFDEMFGQVTIIIDVSLTGLSAAACLAALAIDFILATAHEPLRQAMSWLRRTHVIVTVVYMAALFGSAWLFTQWPDTPGAETSRLFSRARTALFVYEFTKATVFPVQALFAASALAVVTLDRHQGRLKASRQVGR
jgi:hypothetical protein